MATVTLHSNVKAITSGNVPTTANLSENQFAIGPIGGELKLYGNIGGQIYELVGGGSTQPNASVYSVVDGLNSFTTPLTYAQIYPEGQTAETVKYGELVLFLNGDIGRITTVSTDNIGLTKLEATLATGRPVEIATEADMNAELVSENVGKFYKYTGTTGTYTNGSIYLITE